MKSLTQIVKTERAPGVLLVALAFAAIPLILLAGSDQWFNLDEWAFLADNDMPSLGAAFAEHNGHWVTLPRVSYYVLFSIFGLNTYLPYQVLVVLTHLGAVLLSYLVSRRMGVGAWLAAGVAAALLLLGSGVTNLVFAFQITLNGSLVLGLTQLLLADHDGPIGRRDAWGLAAGLVGLLTSAIMVPMIVGVGVATLLRRGWQAAAFHAGIPLGVFAAWYLVSVGDSSSAKGTWHQTIRLFFDLMIAPFDGMGQHRALGALLAAVALFAIGDLALDFRETRDRTPLAVPAALIVAWVLFCGVTAVNRSALLPFFADFGSAGRYVHVGAILMSPLIALGAWRLRRFHSALVWVPVAVLALGAPGNVQALFDHTSITEEDEVTTVAIVHSDYISRVPADSQPYRLTFDPYGEYGFDAGWLRGLADTGDLPGPEGLTASERLKGDLLVVTGGPRGAADDPPCEPTQGVIETTVDGGDVVVFSSAVVLQLTDGEALSAPRLIGAEGVHTLEILAGPIDLRVGGWNGEEPVVCIA